MIITPKVKGFICITAHPEGCSAHVQQQIDYILSQPKLSNGPKKVLIIGASTGYGLASRISAAFGSDADTIGVFFERPATGKRTASAGWYNTAAFEQKAHAAGRYAKSINGDAFSEEIKQQTVDLIMQDWKGEVDLVIYSLASPRRTDPVDGITYQSTLKTMGAPFTDKTVDVMKGEISEITLGPANEEEVSNTVKVMGGEDWLRWMEVLSKANALANNAMTISYSYVGPQLTFPIYREGTIGQAKVHMEETAADITQLLSPINGRAFVSVNKGLVTQASSAIPVVPLYFALLFKVMKAKGTHEGCIEQIARLFNERLYQESIPVDDENRIRIDDWELDDEVQTEVAKLWAEVTTDNLESISDITGYRKDFYQLFGFEMPGVDYEVDVDPEVEITSMS